MLGGREVDFHAADVHRGPLRQLDFLGEVTVGPRNFEVAAVSDMGGDEIHRPRRRRGVGVFLRRYRGRRQQHRRQREENRA